MTTEDWARVLEDDHSPEVRLVYADWLEDNGYDGLAEAYRELGKRGKRPIDVSSCSGTTSTNWVWLSADYHTANHSHAKSVGGDEGVRRATVWDKRLFNEMVEERWGKRGEGAYGACPYDTFTKAEEALAAAYLRLRLAQVQQETKKEGPHDSRAGLKEQGGGRDRDHVTNVNNPPH